MNALVAGSGSYIVRLSVRDLHGPTHWISITLMNMSVGVAIHTCDNLFILLDYNPKV